MKKILKCKKLIIFGFCVCTLFACGITASAESPEPEVTTFMVDDVVGWNSNFKILDNVVFATIGGGALFSLNDYYNFVDGEKYTISVDGFDVGTNLFGEAYTKAKYPDVREFMGVYGTDFTNYNISLRGTSWEKYLYIDYGVYSWIRSITIMHYPKPEPPIKSSTTFVVSNVVSVVEIIVKNPLLLLGIAMLVAGFLISIYYKLRG